MSARSAALLVCVALLGCQFDAALSADVRVDCTDGGICPPGSSCRPALGQCISTSASDVVAPQLASFSVDPRVLREGSALMVSGLSNESLAVTRVRLGSSSHKAQTDQRAFSLSLSFDGSEPEGLSPVTVELVDQSGNASTFELGAVRIDATPPAVLGLTWVSPVIEQNGTVRAPASQPVHLRVRATETVRETARLLATPRGCTSGPVSFMLVGANLETLDFRTSELDPACTYALTLEGLGDVVGNVVERIELVSSLQTDASAPSVDGLRVERPDGTAALTFSRQPGFERLVVRFRASAAADRVSVTVADLAQSASVAERCEPVEPDGARACSVELQVGAASPAGTHIVSASVIDDAGNIDSERALVAFDLVGPQVPDGSVKLQVTGGTASALALATVTAVGPGATAAISLGLDETAASTTLQVGSRTVAAAMVSGGRVTFRVEGDLLSEACHPLVLVATDGVGNRTQTPLVLPATPCGLVVDRTPPAPIDVRTPDRVVFMRRPFGTLARQPSWRVIGGAGALAEGVEVHALTQQVGGQQRSVVGRGLALAQGAFDVSLLAPDRLQVQVVALDEAGNSSAERLVLDVGVTLTPEAPPPAQQADLFVSSELASGYGRSVAWTTPLTVEGQLFNAYDTVATGPQTFVRAPDGDLLGLEYLDCGSESCSAVPGLTVWSPLQPDRALPPFPLPWCVSGAWHQGRGAAICHSLPATVAAYRDGGFQLAAFAPTNAYEADIVADPDRQDVVLLNTDGTFALPTDGGWYQLDDLNSPLYRCPDGSRRTSFYLTFHPALRKVLMPMSTCSGQMVSDVYELSRTTGWKKLDVNAVTFPPSGFPGLVVDERYRTVWGLSGTGLFQLTAEGWQAVRSSPSVSLRAGHQSAWVEGRDFFLIESTGDSTVSVEGPGRPLWLRWTLPAQLQYGRGYPTPRRLEVRARAEGSGFRLDGGSAVATPGVVLAMRLGFNWAIGVPTANGLVVGDALLPENTQVPPVVALATAGETGTTTATLRLTELDATLYFRLDGGTP